MEAMKNQHNHFARLSPLLAALTLTSCITGTPKDLTPHVSEVEETPNYGPATVLFVGNSFTYWNNMFSIAENIGKSIGMDIKCDSVHKGSQKLINTASSGDELGAQLDEKLVNKKYTHVILQEHSTTPTSNYSTFVEAVNLIKAKINATQEDPEIYLYSTWAYQNFCQNGETIPEAEARIREAYTKAANETETKLSHVGKAFSYVYKTHPEIGLYYGDNKHPSYAGSYLAAAVHLSALFHVDVRGSSFLGDSNQVLNYGSGDSVQAISRGDADILLDVAYQVGKNLIH